MDNFLNALLAAAIKSGQHLGDNGEKEGPHYYVSIADFEVPVFGVFRHAESAMPITNEELAWDRRNPTSMGFCVKDCDTGFDCHEAVRTAIQAVYHQQFVDRREHLRAVKAHVNEAVVAYQREQYKDKPTYFSFYDDGLVGISPEVVERTFHELLFLVTIKPGKDVLEAELEATTSYVKSRFGKVSLTDTEQLRAVRNFIADFLDAGPQNDDDITKPYEYPVIDNVCTEQSLEGLRARTPDEQFLIDSYDTMIVAHEESIAKEEAYKQQRINEIDDALALKRTYLANLNLLRQALRTAP